MFLVVHYHYHFSSITVFAQNLVSRTGIVHRRTKTAMQEAMATDASRFKAALFKNAASFFVSGHSLCITRSGVFNIMEEIEKGCDQAVESCLVDHVPQDTGAYSYFVFYSIFVDEPYVLKKRYNIDICWLHEVCWEAHDKHRVQPEEAGTP